MKTIWLILWAAGLLNLSAAAARAENLIRNGGFEEPSADGSLPLGWEKRPGSGQPYIEWDKTGAHTGRASGYVAGGKLEIRAGWQQEFPVSPESCYRMIAWVQADPPGSRYLIGLEYLDRRGAWVSRHNLFGTVSGSAWQEVSEPFATPIDAVSCRITLRAWQDGEVRAAVRFDDIRVEPLPSAKVPAAVNPAVRRARPVSIAEDGVLRVSGQPFFSIGLYDVPSEAFPLIRSWGFNTVMTGGGGEAGQNALDRAQENGLKAIHHPGGAITTPEGRAEIADAVRRLRGHPALLAWYPIDEPEINGITREAVEEAYRAIYREDGGHPVFQTLYYPSAYPIFTKGRDILSIDPYPVPIRPLISIARALMMARKEAQPVWLIPQAFYGVIWPRSPSPGELRCMVYTGLIHGAKGIIYYTFGLPGEPGSWRLPETALWPAIRTLNREVRILAPALLHGKPADIFVESSGTLTRDWRGEEAVHTLALRYRNRLYILAVNLAEEPYNASFRSAPLAATFRLPGRHTGPVRLPLEGRTLGMKDGVFHDRFEGYETHVYVVEQGSLK
ncbi:MAG: hypothetical protein IT210_07170 [Armatimonadetes bacterium]|nr:hypothetical protein [Armatimonadota bacterium]